MAADLTLDLWGALLSGQFMRRTTTFPDVPGEPDRTAVGWHASVGYRAPLGISAAYRVASYDPTASFEAEDPATKAQLDVDELMYHTIGLTWAVPERPLKLQLNYTMAVENDARAIDNNRFDALVQIVF